MPQVKKSQDPNYQAQAILARRPHAEFELRQKLKRKKFTAEQIDNAVAKLKHLKLIDDESFARSFVNTTLLLKPVGPRWLTFKLKQRGVKEELINQAIEHEFVGDRENQLAREASARWRRAHPKHQDDQQRLYRFLQSRGFSSAAISSAQDSVVHEDEPEFF